MTQGYYAAITGLHSNQYGLDVISDNLSNIETVGFKSSTAEFANLFSKTLKTASSSAPTTNDIGYGSTLQATSFNFSQGALMPSDRITDLAIEGNGWFGIAKNSDETYFTRDGHFLFDTFESTPGDVNSSASRLITLSGHFVKGTMLQNYAYQNDFDYGDTESNGVSGAYVISTPTAEVPLGDIGSQTELSFPTRLAYPAEPTSVARFYGNLGIENTTRTMSANAISPNGDKNHLKLVFTQSAVQPANGISWDIAATITSRDGSTVYDTQTGQAVFGDAGLLQSLSLPSMNNDGAMVEVDLGGAFGGIISSSGPAISASSQSDGLEKGYLTKYGINMDGIIIADFSNGRQSAIGRVAVYHFQNDQGLNREGGTYYTQSSDSGDPLFWTDANGNYTTGAAVRSGALEASNVRTDVGLTEMLITQRAYQANAKTISTVDEMIQKALSMRR